MAKSKTVLICGGSGLVGRRLQIILKERGFRVLLLSRRQASESEPDRFYWDPERGFLNPNAISGADYIVNLAGAGVAEKKWSARRKQEIVQSRVMSAELIYKKLTEMKSYPQAYISAGAIGYYGNRGDELVNEDSAHGTGFLAETCVQWEKAAQKMSHPSMRNVILRIGVVLARDGGALPAMAQPVRLFAGAPLGTGAQYVSWIHLEDVCQILVRAIEDDNYEGVYNAVAPTPVTNAALTQAIARRLNKPLVLPNIPDFALRFLMGEMAAMVLEGQRVSAAHVSEDGGYEFRFPEIDGALADLLDV